MGVSEAVGETSVRRGSQGKRRREGSALGEDVTDLLEQSRRCSVRFCETVFETEDGDRLSSEDDDSDGGHKTAKKGLWGVKVSKGRGDGGKTTYS